MEPSGEITLPESDHVTPEAELDRLEHLEARVRALEDRVPKTRLLSDRFLPRAFAVLGHYLVASAIIYAAVLAATLLIGTLGFGGGSIADTLGEDAVPEGPMLNSVASLPVDAAGAGTLKGMPTGEAESSGDSGSFELVLDPAPAGLPTHTTLDVAIDHSTKVYSGSRLLGDALTGLDAVPGPHDADPTAAGTVVVRFHIQDGQVFADRLDLSDELPDDYEPNDW